MRIAVSKDGVSLDNINIYDTPKSFDEALDLFSTFKGGSFKVIAGGVPGILDKEKNSLVRSPNLHGWVGVTIKNKLEESFGTKVILENDAALAGLGEACFGADRDKRIIAYLTISTGIGGARIVDKKIDVCSWGFEPGKQIIDADITIWPESINFNSESLPSGCLESYISGAALNYRYGKSSVEIKDPDIWREVEKLLAVAINNTIAYWSPEVVILGGGIVLEKAVSLDNIYENLATVTGAFPELPEVKKAELGDGSALYGAIALIEFETENSGN